MNYFVIFTLFCCYFNLGDSEVTHLEDRLPDGFPIVPGTLWCGNGNISSNDDDLGTITKTDKCCRDHDMCPDSIPAGEYKHGLYNNGWFTRSHCNCDHGFYECLKEAGNPLSVATGTTYFTILGPKCFEKTKLISKCLKTKFGRCIEYEYQDDDELAWQWFDNPIF